MSSRSSVWAFAFAALAAAVVWAYWPILDNGLVWDDGANLIAAREAWDRGLRGTAWAFRETVAGHYQPLTWVSYQLDALLSGATPRGVHATQLVLHLLVTAAVAVLATALAATPALRGFRGLRGVVFPLFAAALFSLAPVRVESVAWATERRDLLGALFTLAAIILYLRRSPPDSAPSPVRHGVAILAALSALSRAQMSLPLVLLLVDIWPLGRLAAEAGPGSQRWVAWWRLLREKALLFAIACASAVAAMWAQSSSGALTPMAEHGVAERLVQAGFGLAYYPVAALLPQLLPPLLPLYQRPSPFPTLGPLLLVALVSLLALVAVVVWRRRWPAGAVAVGAYVLLVLPVLGLAQSGIQLVADRYAYLATIPLVLLVAGALARVVVEAPTRVLRLVVASLLALGLGAGAVAVRAQTRIWYSDETLWRHVLANSEAGLAHNNLGQILAARGETGPAIFHLTSCLEQTPEYGRPWRALAAILEAPWPADGPPAAWVAKTLARAVPFQGGHPLARYATALAWHHSGNPDRAERELRLVLALEPDHDGARLALARIQARRSVSERALATAP